MAEPSTPCADGHTWTHQYGDDWTPEVGTRCDCGKKQWGIPLVQAREHKWEFYANGSFCKLCGSQLGDGRPCR